MESTPSDLTRPSESLALHVALNENPGASMQDYWKRLSQVRSVQPKALLTQKRLPFHSTLCIRSKDKNVYYSTYNYHDFLKTVGIASYINDPLIPVETSCFFTSPMTIKPYSETKLNKTRELYFSKLSLPLQKTSSTYSSHALFP